MSEMDFDIRKALDTSAGTTGANLIPELVDENIREFVDRSSKVYSLVNRRPWANNAYRYRDVTALPTATFAADGANLPADTRGTYGKRVATIKYLYSKGRVTGPMIQASPIHDVYSMEVRLHTLAMLRQIELDLIAGDEVADADEFNGFDKQFSQTTMRYNAQVAAADVPLTLPILDAAIDLPNEEMPTHAIMSKAMKRRIWTLVQADVRWVNDGDVHAGVTVPTYHGLPVVDTYDNGTILANQVFLPYMPWVVMPINLDFTFEELATVDVDARTFYLKWYGTLAVEGTDRTHVRLFGVLPTA